MAVRNAILLLVAMLMSCFSYAAKNPTDLQRGAICGSHVKKMSDIIIFVVKKRRSGSIPAVMEAIDRMTISESLTP